MIDKKDLPIRPIFGIPIFSGTEDQLLSFLPEVISGKLKAYPFILFTPNPEQMTMMFHQKAFSRCFLQSDLNVPDGHGLVWALRRLYPEATALQRIAGRTLCAAVLTYAKKQKKKVFLLGGRPGSARMVLQSYGNPKGWVADPGAHNIKAETEEEHQNILTSLRVERPDILCVAYGAPWQEEWVMRNKEALGRCGVKFVMVVGGSLDYIAGMVPPVPGLFERLHLEWLHRLIHQPWRWRRQLRGTEFFWRVLTLKK